MDLQGKIENMISKDKLLHFCAGLILAQLAYVCIWFIFLPLVVGIAKELYDMCIRKTGFNIFDLIATITGAVPALIIWLIK